MASLQIPELRDDVYEALAERARREGRTLAQQALTELQISLKSPPPLGDDAFWLHSVSRGPARTQPDPVELVREDRDA